MNADHNSNYVEIVKLVVSDLKPKVHSYFVSHTESRNDVMKAYYAYHVEHFRLNPKAHNFLNGSTTAKCTWCGRSRRGVRWDDLPPECSNRPNMPDIKDVVFGEERRSFDLFNRAEKEVPKIISKLGMSGKTLSILHHTYGYDPETVAGIVDISPQLLSDYNKVMEVERERSRNAQVMEVITICK
jgi:hypothetical protein